jgi:hypothetical protein
MSLSIKYSIVFVSFVFFSFFSTVISFSPLQALQASQTSYCDSTSITEWTCETCDPTMTFESIVEHHGERGILGVYEKERVLLVAFRGSSNIQNWLDNVQFSRICPYEDAPDVCVEKGFYKVFEYMKEDVMKELMRLSGTYGTQKVVCTGHSLGAAVATLFAYHIQQEYGAKWDVSLITFGSPRIGNKAFVEGGPRHGLRITHANDMVVHVPQMILGYEHVPHEEWYNEDNSDSMECDDEDGEDPNCSDSCGPLRCTSVDDHLYYLNISLGTDGAC